MAFCPKCGKMLAENEICNCSSGDNSPLNSIPTPPPAPGPAPAPEIKNTQNVYNNISAGQPQKKKTSVGLILLLIFVPIILIVLIVVGILAAILVPSMSGYVNKSKVQSQNMASSSVSKAVNSALTEMDEEGYKVSGYYLISSDKSKNVNVPSSKFDLDSFYKKVDNFYPDNSKSEWFVVVDYGTAVYVASAESWSSKTVGTYPNTASPDGAYKYGSYTRTKDSLKDIYSDAKKQVK